MTQDEVRGLLGQPNLRDVRDFPERGVTAWFYTKDAEGKRRGGLVRQGEGRAHRLHGRFRRHRDAAQAGSDAGATLTSTAF